MNTATLHLLWSVVEETPSELLADVNHNQLVNLLINRIEERVRLSQAERLAIRQYLKARLPLIKDSVNEQVI